jgi:DNA-directed RNA polymerase I subunit RPA2
MGFIPHAAAPQLVEKLRFLKVKKLEEVPWSLELGLVPAGASKQYPGLFMWTTPARMMRPVKYLATGDTEYIGSFEQVHSLHFPI